VDPNLALYLAIGGLVVTLFAATSARSLSTFSRHELEDICTRKKTLPRLGKILKRYESVGLTAETVQAISTAVVIGLGVYLALTKKSPDMADHDWLFLVSVIATGALLLLSAEIWLPWALARLWAARIVYRTWSFWLVVSSILRPLTWGERFFDTFFHRLAGRTREEPNEESFEDEIRTIVTEGRREGLLEEDARDMIEGVIELSDLNVSEIMTPRTDMVSIPLSCNWEELLALVINQGHSRIPVHEKNRDDIIGILFTKDLLPELTAGKVDPERSWKSLLREPYYIPETKSIDILLQEFQRTQNHMAIVLDEYGGVSGLVTMEDVLEEIVGEIADEYDMEIIDGIHQINETIWEALGSVHIDEINERLDLNLREDGDFDTIGGLIFTELGHVPLVGEELVTDEARISVAEVTQRRILRVRIEIPKRSTGEND
jgi:magnesium and cobalt exporter, CNNM family